MIRPVSLKWKIKKNGKSFTSSTDRDDISVTPDTMVESLVKELLEDPDIIQEGLTREDLEVSDWEFEDTHNKVWTDAEQVSQPDDEPESVSENLGAAISQSELDKLQNSKEADKSYDVDTLLNNLTISKPSNAYHLGRILQAVLSWKDSSCESIAAEVLEQAKYLK